VEGAQTLDTLLLRDVLLLLFMLFELKAFSSQKCQQLRR
jgi:hypothetical protein